MARPEEEAVGEDVPGQGKTREGEWRQGERYIRRKVERRKGAEDRSQNLLIHNAGTIYVCMDGSYNH